ncbi:adenylate/guanylate cyclase [Magnetococcus marinus MC-1]|uniref:Adenylate/guanylate cyclase n=1 Tax=Magnetococcus marinus (strain ATCC BAA-1437 / JCM 17883 / MC-1) TaxID=156889 RepID=A0L7Z9_MAGMM|nr:adenylate/guanylate cyclase domain-containing protein [Magnetococcus marinus]ABK44092.1 adenylate/guanylate cyclase [Magnetococcus marinus MC-1]
MDSSPQTGSIHLKLHALAGVAVLFLSFYGKQVCPFIDKVNFLHLFTTLSTIAVVQIGLRVWMLRRFHKPSHGISPARQQFRLSVLNWLVTGVLACLVCWQVYGTAFHWSSYLKLLVGYWALGAGLLAQLEYILLEQHMRRFAHLGQGQERITIRLLEAFAAFTIVPALVMTLISFRFVYEGYLARSAAFEVLFLAICFVGGALFVAWHYGRALHRDCTALTEALQQVTQGHFGVRVDSSRADELGSMAQGLNEMGQGLLLRERIRDAFGRFVNPQVADAFIQRFSQGEQAIQMGGERKEITIMMADLRQFTPLSESLPPEALTELLNSYLSVMVQVIQQHGGMIDKFIGDAILALFGLGHHDQPAQLQAVLAAQAMQVALADFNEKQRAKGAPTLNNGIGLHHGEVVAGYIGSTDRLEFTVIGHNVNMAARIESMTKAPNPSLLFSQSVADAVAHTLPVRQVTIATLKGISEPIPLYTLADPQ